jgi:hypothetical protein
VLIEMRDRNDLAWDGESKRIIAVGDGNEAFVLLCLIETDDMC